MMPAPFTPSMIIFARRAASLPRRNIDAFGEDAAGGVMNGMGQRKGKDSHLRTV